MPNLFGNFVDDPRMQRQALMSKYNAARINLIAVVAFTAINMITLAFGAGSYFLISANLPYMLTFFGMYMCGMMPDKYYEGSEGMVFLNKSFFAVTLTFSILVLALLFLCWFFSRRGKVSWLKTALALFIIDSISMFIFGSAGMLVLDVAFHAWVIVVLVMGIKAHKQIMELKKSESPIEGDFTDITDEMSTDEEDSLEEMLLEEGESDATNLTASHEEEHEEKSEKNA